jgi:hypothetical protein
MFRLMAVHGSMLESFLLRFANRKSVLSITRC